MGVASAGAATTPFTTRRPDHGAAGDATLALQGAKPNCWAPASVVSPFYYVQLVWASVLGYLIFGDVPSGWTWLGAVIIIASGLSVAWRATSRIEERR